MKRFLYLISLFFITNQITQAENITPDELLTRFKTHRSAVYQKLDLTSQQAASIKQIDEKVYIQLEPELKKISIYINKLDEIAASNDCTMERIEAVKKEFEATEKRVSEIKSQHEKAINNILSTEQKAVYEDAKEAQRAEIEKEIENYKKEQKKNERT